MILDLILRWAHIMAAITLVGGTFFLRFAFTAADGDTSEQRRTLLSAWRPGWARLVMISSGLLLVSGLINAVRIIIAYEFPTTPYHALVAVKLLLAMVIFWLSAVLSGRSQTADKFREKLSFWLTVNVILAVLIVALANYMKFAERVPKPTAHGATAVSSRLT